MMYLQFLFSYLVANCLKKIMKCILYIATLISFILTTNLVNVYSQVHLAEKVFPSGFNIQNGDAISQLSNLLDSNFKKSLELAYEYHEIAYTRQYNEVHDKDTIEIIQIKLKPERTNIWRESIYFIKNPRKGAMIYCNADTLFSKSIKGRIIYIFLSRYRAAFYNEIYCFDKSQCT